ncbi:MAG: nucleotidyl transferase AbiEii/AbiGii toxin family protein [Acidimicrobiia bacterium]
MPCEQLSIRSLIASTAGDRIAGTVEAQPMPVKVLEPSRTLVEKLILLHTAHSDPDPVPAVRAARHFYDVERLLGQPRVLERLGETDVSVLARDVCTYSTIAGRPARPRPAGGLAASPAFGGGPHVALARGEFEGRVIGQLLWPRAPRPSFEDCVNAVRGHAELL